MTTPLLRFDENQIRSQLERLPEGLRAIFPASCAERQYGAHVARYADPMADPHSLRKILDAVWGSLKGEALPHDHLERFYERCLETLPNQDDDWTEASTALTEDVIMTVAYTLRFLMTRNVAEAAWAARCAYESLDQQVLRRLEGTVTGPEDELMVLNHPAVQAELERQQRDLRDLTASSARSRDIPQVAEALRRRALTDAVVFRLARNSGPRTDPEA